MTQSNVGCSKCGGELQSGFLLDRGDLEVRHPAVWVAGPPKKSLWMGTKIEGREKFEIAAKRCVKCGYLELYALEEES